MVKIFQLSKEDGNMYKQNQDQPYHEATMQIS